MYFCSDVDLLGWEPGIFLEVGFGHQAVVREAAGTLTGTGLVMGAAVLASVLPGMVAEAVTRGQVGIEDGQSDIALEKQRRMWMGGKPQAQIACGFVCRKASLVLWMKNC